jgi:hypothetical protein
MEKEIMPGVYLSDYRKVFDEAPIGNDSKPFAPQSSKKELLEADILELNNQIRHLIRSNNELLEAYRDDPDPVYRESIEENLFLVSKKKKLVEVRSHYLLLLL